MGNDDMVFQLNIGRNDLLMTAGHTNQAYTCQTGEGCFVTRTVPSSIRSKVDNDGLLNIAFSRATLGTLISAKSDVVTAALPSDQTLGLFARCALDAFATPETNAQERAAELHDLAAGVLGADGQTAKDRLFKRTLPKMRLRAIKADIAAHITRPDLSLDWIARRHCISGSYVRALFDQESTSFTDYLVTRRLSRVHRILSNPLYRDRPISEIAIESGFNNLSWFYRAFKRRFEITPSDLRS